MVETDFSLRKKIDKFLYFCYNYKKDRVNRNYLYTHAQPKEVCTMNKGPKKAIGWLDWQVALSLILFVVLMLCSVYYDIKILKFVAIVPALYGIVRTFARAMA